MATGPNQILIKRSDVSGVVPSGLSLGEPAINVSDGILYFSQQTEGNPTTDYWEFKGFTNEGYVQSVNGATGAVKAASSVGISNGGGFSDISGIAFSSSVPGITVSITQHGDTAAVSIESDVRATQGAARYSFGTTTGALNAVNADSNGEFLFNTDTNKISIHKFDVSGADNRDRLSSAFGASAGQIEFVVDGSGSNDVNILYYSGANLNYDGTNFDADIYNTFPTDITGANGKQVLLTFMPSELIVTARSHFSGPDGVTFGTVVTSFNGETGDVLTSDDILHVAGLSTGSGGISIGGVIEAHSGMTVTGPTTFVNGITLSGNMTVHDTFEIVNDDGNALFDISAGRNVIIGDVDDVGSSNTILIRDSHDLIQCETSSFNINADVVKIGKDLQHFSDANTKLEFPANDQITFMAGGITFASSGAGGTLCFDTPVGISSAGATFSNIVNLHSTGVKFSDGTSQTTAASGSGGGGGVTFDFVAGVVVDGAGSVVTTGSKGYRRIPSGCTLTNVFSIGDTGGTCEFHIMRSSGGDIGGTTVGIAGVSGGGITSEFTNVAGFSTNYAAGDLLEFVVIGTPAKITRASVTMTFEKDI